jgi:hypothetical protein
LQNLLELGMSHSNSPSWMHIQHIYLLLHDCLYLLHVHKLENCVDIIGLALG